MSLHNYNLAKPPIVERPDNEIESFIIEYVPGIGSKRYAAYIEGIGANTGDTLQDTLTIGNSLRPILLGNAGVNTLKQITRITGSSETRQFTTALMKFEEFAITHQSLANSLIHIIGRAEIQGILGRGPEIFDLIDEFDPDL